MQIDIIQEITFNTEDTIAAAALSGADEFVLLISNGDVVRYKVNQPVGDYLFSVKSPFEYQDGGFDITAKTTIYTLDDIVVVVNDFKRHGFVHYPGKFNVMPLWRKEYHVEITTYPIALYKNEKGIPHLIYATDWNHLQVMNLDTQQVLTAAKYLIEEGAEERYLELQESYASLHGLPWPKDYDYFYGKLLMSPNQKQFLSAGWVWGSMDNYTVYDLDHFVNSNRIVAKSIGGWEHESRAVCWIDNETVAVAYNPLTDLDDAPADVLPEIHILKIDNETVTTALKIVIADFDIMNATLSYYEKNDSIVAISKTLGVMIVALDGTVLFKDATLKADSFYNDKGLFLKAENKTITLFQLM